MNHNSTLYVGIGGLISAIPIGLMIYGMTGSIPWPTIVWGSICLGLIIAGVRK